jgi:hypothetical protein
VVKIAMRAESADTRLKGLKLLWDWCGFGAHQENQSVEGIPRGFEQTFGRDLTKQVALNLGTVWGERWRMVSEAWRWQERPLPDYVQREFEDYLRCGRLEHGFLRVRCDTCQVEHLVAFSCKRRGFCPSCGARRMVESAALLVDEVFPEQPVRQWVLSIPYKKAEFTRQGARTGAVTLIQRFGSALNLNLHFHMLFLDGVYIVVAQGTVGRSHWVKAPTTAELNGLMHAVAERVGRFLQRQGLLECDGEQSYLAAEAVDEGTMAPLLAHSITYRIAAGRCGSSPALKTQR